MWVLWFAIPLFVVVILAVLSFFRSRSAKTIDFKGAHVVVTGGSDGLGLAFCCLVAERGAHVTVLARNAGKLAQAKELIESKRASKSQRVLAISCDVSDAPSVEKALSGLEQVDVLVANAGLSIPKLFADQTVGELSQMMNVNFFGSAYAARSVLPAMQKTGKGRIVFVASAMSLTAFAGYGGYCASKWAVRGLAECLQSELAPSGVSVQIFYAPTMKTAGLAAENLVKPAVTHELESIGDALEAGEAAAALLRGVEAGRFEVAGDAGAELLAMASLGSPYYNTSLRLLCAPLLVPLAAAWRWHTRRIARKHLAKRK